MYVLKINKEDNAIIVGEKEYLSENVINIEQLNWLGSKDTKNQLIKDIFVKVRARQTPSIGNLQLLRNKKGIVNLGNHTFGVARGQGCVFYSKKGQLLGGGWII